MKSDVKSEDKSNEDCRQSNDAHGSAQFLLVIDFLKLSVNSWLFMAEEHHDCLRSLDVVRSHMPVEGIANDEPNPRHVGRKSYR